MPCVQCKHFAVKSPDLSVSFLCVPRLFFHTLAHPFSTQSFRFFILARCDDYSNNAGIVFTTILSRFVNHRGKMGSRRCGSTSRPGLILAPGVIFSQFGEWFYRCNDIIAQWPAGFGVRLWKVVVRQSWKLLRSFWHVICFPVCSHVTGFYIMHVEEHSQHRPISIGVLVIGGNTRPRHLTLHASALLADIYCTWYWLCFWLWKWVFMKESFQ